MHVILFAIILPFFQPLLGKLTTVDITLTTLDTKLTPFELEADADPKDMKLRKRARFKPSGGQAELEVKKRFTFQARRDGASARLCQSKTVSGDVRAWTRVAVDSLVGIVGTAAEGKTPTVISLGSVPLAEGAVSLRAAAMWDEALGGLSLQALVDGVPTGEPQEFAGLKEVFLVVERAGGFDAVSWALPISDEYDGFGTLQPLLPPQASVPGPISLDVAVENLDRKGRVYLAQTTFRFTPGTLMGANPTETTFGETLFDAFLAVDTVDTALFFPFGGFEFLLTQLNTSRVALDQLFLQLTEEGTAFDPTTPVDQIEKQLQRASKAVDKAILRAEKLQAADAQSHKPLKRTVNRAQKGLRIASALLMGFKTQSLGRLDKAVNY